MAADVKPEAGTPARKKSSLPLVIAVLVLIAGAGGAWWFLKPKPAGDGKPAAQAAAARAAAIYYKFDPAFVVNFGSEGNSRYLQITLEAMSRDQGVIDAIKNNEPAIRNDLVLLYSAQQPEALLAPEGKEKLRQATLDAVRKTVVAEGARAEAVEAVYFTSFVIQ
ncbi:MAG: flagellar basal body-associated FliL family protein [Gammaproteobacteria bacterium]|nr:flagellar basal body-associated FliL family protein [Gammaproteobacteria bacterium]MDE2250893.1 flagellar basal body-associated FliL family protein [Gammaproteobacteria bacterium]